MRKEFHLSDQSFYYKTFRNFAVRQRLKSDGNSCYTQTRRNTVNVSYIYLYKIKNFCFRYVFYFKFSPSTPRLAKRPYDVILT